MADWDSLSWDISGLIALVLRLEFEPSEYRIRLVAALGLENSGMDSGAQVTTSYQLLTAFIKHTIDSRCNESIQQSERSSSPCKVCI